MKKEIFEEMSRRLADSLPGGLGELRRDIERNFTAVLHSGFQRLDLVTREEFEVQREVLARTRAKVDALEQQVKELEGKLGGTPQGHG